MFRALVPGAEQHGSVLCSELSTQKVMGDAGRWESKSSGQGWTRMPPTKWGSCSSNKPSKKLCLSMLLYAPRMAKRVESGVGQNITCAHTWPVCKISTANLLRKPYLKQLPFLKPKSTFIQVFIQVMCTGAGRRGSPVVECLLSMKEAFKIHPLNRFRISLSTQTGLLEPGHETQMPYSHQTAHWLKDTFVE